MALNELFGLDGKTALVTGASRGIGRAIAIGLADAGADVAVVARRLDPLKEVAADIESLGRRALVFACDTTEAAPTQRMVSELVDEFGALDIVVNNVGGFSHIGPFLELSGGDWARVVHSNLDSTVNVCAAVGPHLVRHGGSVINVASIAGLAGVAALSPYAAAKAAVISLTRTLATEWASAGVRVNAVAPGWVDTELTQRFAGDAAASAELMRAVPMGRWGTPEDIIGTVIYLAGNASRLVTGSCVTVDGGTTCNAGGPAMTELLAMGRIPV
ncbi:SDR family NAD(P)-dependent oxidoreductase [Nocardia wallacei]|uniref:SDR family NAD(P)-dependent oxidoreductase n=2 Tax=Nocardia wallacei TaxID=480035 RepID=UPI00245899F5|nr:SDR family NAD(P)-dependent oxidoreductase [Nocardia wallacei]